MVFSSAIFLLCFLPLFLAAYYLTPARHRSLAILAGSYLFYGWWRLDFLALFFLTTLLNYYVSLRMCATPSPAARRRWLAFGVTADLLSLGYFKYFNFGVEAMNAALQAAGFQELHAWSVILPIGISFYTFHAISYLVDIHRGDAELADKFTDFAAFLALFPQLVAGPVLRYKDLFYQFRSRTHTVEKFNEGALRFAAGFCKKVLIADTLAPLADMAFAAGQPSMADAWLGALAYAAQLYFDFSGYSDMAVGLALMMGFRFIENFNHPYISRSITEFWRRWHISLSTWLRDYLYVPLGGNRKGRVRTYVNLWLTMLLGGLWHGANWTFVLWGAWHGTLLAIERLLGAKRENPYPKFVALPLTFFFVLLGWTIFRAPDAATALTMYAGMFGLHGLALSDTLAWQITGLERFMLLYAYAHVFLAPRLMRPDAVEYGVLKPSWAARVPLTGQAALMLLFLLAVSKMITESYSPFLYFQF